MKSPIRAAAVVAAMALMLSSAQAGSIRYDLHDVDFGAGLGGAPAGTLTGYFVTNAARTQLHSFHLESSANTAAGMDFAKTIYTPSTVTGYLVNGAPGLLAMDIGLTRVLELNFIGGLNDTGNSSIRQYLSGELQVSLSGVSARYTLRGGYVTATTVPEPSSIAMTALAAGAGALAALRRRRAAARGRSRSIPT